VQLIEAASDKHIWAENYDRDLDDIFAIQSDIAVAIADQLTVVLDPSTQLALGQRNTEDAHAYDLYLRAMAQRNVWRGAAGFRSQIALLEPVITRDPDFLKARVELVQAYGRILWLREEDAASYAGKARAQLAEIVRRRPDSIEARIAQAQITYLLERDFASALAQFQAIAAERPNDAGLAAEIAACLKHLDRFPEQLVASRRAVALDPEAYRNNGDLVLALAYSNGAGLRRDPVAPLRHAARIHR